jgi:SnoaL-like domain
MAETRSAESIARELIDAFSAVDIHRMRSLLADDLRACVTNSEGGVDEVGADEYVQRVARMDLPSAQFGLNVTQAVQPSPDMVLAMVEIDACRGDRTLHNHATHCFFIRDGLVAEWWMVEAVPADSDAFWSS